MPINHVMQWNFGSHFSNFRLLFSYFSGEGLGGRNLYFSLYFPCFGLEARNLFCSVTRATPPTFLQLWLWYNRRLQFIQYSSGVWECFKNEVQDFYPVPGCVRLGPSTIPPSMNIGWDLVSYYCIASKKHRMKAKMALTWGPRLGLEVPDVLLPRHGNNGRPDICTSRMYLHLGVGVKRA